MRVLSPRRSAMPLIKIALTSVRRACSFARSYQPFTVGARFSKKCARYDYRWPGTARRMAILIGLFMETLLPCFFAVLVPPVQISWFCRGMQRACAGFAAGPRLGRFVFLEACLSGNICDPDGPGKLRNLVKSCRMVVFDRFGHAVGVKMVVRRGRMRGRTCWRRPWPPRTGPRRLFGRSLSVERHT